MGGGKVPERPLLVIKAGEDGQVAHRRGRVASSGSAPDVLSEEGGTSLFGNGGEI